jgi:hypothetical protein
VSRPLTHQALTLFAGLALLGSVVACAGGGAVPATPGANSSSAGMAIPGKSGITTAGSGGGTTVTVTTYQNIRPLDVYSGAGVIDFLVTPVTTAGPLVPLNTGAQATEQFVVPQTCSALPPAPPVSASRRTSATASATPPPTPTPTNLPVSNCVIVAYADGANPVQVTGFGSIDGANLIFAATSPGITYTMGVTYTFYIAIATTTTVIVTPSPRPSSTPSCGNKTDNGKHNGNPDTRNEDDHGNHKDCGYHTGDPD